MNRRCPRPVAFVCIADAKCEEIIATSQEEAIDIFANTFGLNPQKIFGPYHKKKKQILEVTRTLTFSDNVAKKAAYNDWLVNAFVLSEPANHAYLVFIKRMDNKKIPTPKGTIIAPITDLRFLDDK